MHVRERVYATRLVSRHALRLTAEFTRTTAGVGTYRNIMPSTDIPYRIKVWYVYKLDPLTISQQILLIAVKALAGISNWAKGFE